MVRIITDDNETYDLPEDIVLGLFPEKGPAYIFEGQRIEALSKVDEHHAET